MSNGGKSFRIRKSNYRHVFYENPKPEQCWIDFRPATVTGEQQYIKASAKYFAIALAGGGGSVLVGRLDRPGRFESSTSSMITGHSGSVFDMDWNPFDDSMLATGSEDCNIKIWQIPEDWEPTDENGIAKKGESLSESVIDLIGHNKKVTLLRYHPSANNTLLSTSADCTVKVWDVENSREVHTFKGTGDLIHDIVWDFRGDSYVACCKDKNIRFLDGRTGEQSMQIEKSHSGAKSIKCAFAREGSDKFLSFGASKQSSREIKIWDLKNLAQPLHTEKIDSAAGAILPLYDQDVDVLYLCGKGDGIVRVYEYEDKAPHIFKLNDGFRSNTPGKGYCLVPKRGLNIMQHETARIMKLTNNNGVLPLMMKVPRKSEAFQNDIFPDCAAPIPAHTCAEWVEGSSKPIERMSLDPRKQGGVKQTKKFKTAATIQKELDVANSRIAMLEEKLKDNDIEF